MTEEAKDDQAMEQNVEHIEKMIEEGEINQEMIDAFLKERDTAKLKRMWRTSGKYYAKKLKFYEETLLGIKNLLVMHYSSLAEENVDLLLDGECACDEYEIPKNIGHMLHIVIANMNELSEVWMEGVDDE
jgi:hypothetical protein